ncbi:hypothetical protein T265_07484 [Opisthorchis viverrini]|uniref:Uncharacterized protein n=1 Tax=Opisthorchis viverrini TaxID=6198 RepID=A0A074ZCS6_OPIVI|nr:hypothetical protein T265_07484 [Opisthorchis viverrini]KER24978.1 hypothetical protein T265_07484 [Opisthorchis viverrini]
MLPFGVRRVVFIRLSMQWRRALVVAPKGALFEVSSYQEKTVTIDDYVGVAISGLTAHGRMLSRTMPGNSLKTAGRTTSRFQLPDSCQRYPL